MRDKQDFEHVNFNTWKKIFKIIFKNKKNLVLIASFSGMIALLEMTFPLLNRYAVDKFFIEGDYSTWKIFVVINVVVALLFSIGVWGFIHQAGMIQSQTSYELRKEAFENLQKQSFSYFDKTPHGWIMARMSSDARRLSSILSWGLVDLVWASLSMITILVILYITFYKLALIITIVLPFMFLTTYFFRKKILKHHRKARSYNSELTAQYNEGFLGAKTTKSLSIEDENFDEFKVTANKLKTSSIRAVISSALFSSILLVLSYVAVSTTMIRGSYYVLFFNGLITIGTLQMFIAYTVSFFEPIMSLSRIVSDFQNAQASAERIVSLIETEPHIKDSIEVEEKYGTLFNSKEENWEELIGDVEFKDINFYYKEDEPILENFNLKIKAGTSVALVGHTGSGKTTIVNLLSRFYEPTYGDILIDGKDYRERSLHWLHKRLGYVLQTPQLFSTTILENIRYGRLTATDEEVIAAAKVCGVDLIVNKLDEGYNTHVGEGGNLISLGEKQLISFARAILANPKILILDEATSSIDSESEQIIQRAIKNLLKDRTSFIIAHRLSTIVEADLIVVLDMGQIIEMGSHEELIKMRGSYFELYKNQFFKEKTEAELN